jgi:hypothetical protein
MDQKQLNRRNLLRVACFASAVILIVIVYLFGVLSPRGLGIAILTSAFLFFHNHNSWVTERLKSLLARQRMAGEIARRSHKKFAKKSHTRSGEASGYPATGALVWVMGGTSGSFLAHTGRRGHQPTFLRSSNSVNTPPA